MRFKRAYIKWLVLLFMNIAISGNADEMTYNSTELDQNIPEAPRNVNAVQVGKSEVLVTWEVPKSQGKQDLTHRVFYAPVEDGDRWKSVDVSSKAAIIGDLSQDKTYTIRVSSVSRLAQGPSALPVTVTIGLLDDCRQCKSEKETSLHCNCSYEILEETCKDACQFRCRNMHGFDPADGCLNGCVTGWYGQYCNMSCPGMCHECDEVTGHCAACMLHWVGPYCNETCPPGLYGENCSRLCPAHCKRCLNQSYCIECQNGRYGELCQNTCHPECLTCVDEPDKCTSCIRGKFIETGSVCLNCPDNCVSCTGRDNCTECKTGKYGPTCQTSCPPNCVTCTSIDQCHKCVPHRNGNKCQCNSKCKSSTEQCETGEVCQMGCPPLKMGIYCNHSCPQNCYKCDQLTGYCFSCVSSFYGPNCNSSCGHCKRNSRGKIQCNKHTGTCDDCMSGWYGRRCDESCSTSCQTVFCDRLTGKCDLCVTGFYGPRCTEKCNKNCHNASLTGCDKQTGFCEVCTDGFFASSCNETCLEYCGKYACEKQTGVCEKCPRRLYGEKCNKSCNLRCQDTDTNKDICDRESGYCIQGCSPGWYNEFCQSPCSATCIDDICHQDTGLCQLGCVDGFTGDTCSLSIHREYLISLDVRQIGTQNVFIQWDKLNLTDIELESVKRLVLNHKVSGSTTADARDVPDWKTRTHYLLQEVDMNSKHTFQLLVLFELQSQSPIISKPVEFELVPRAPGESMLHLTADVELYDFQESRVKLYDYDEDEYIHVTRTECTRVSEETFLSTRQYDKITTAKGKCYINGKDEVMVTGMKFFKDGTIHRRLAVADDKTLAWIMAHF